MIRELLEFFPDNLDYMMLAFMRVFGLIALSPVFGKSLPLTTRLGYVAVLTLACLSIAPKGEAVYSGPVQYMVLAVNELLFGAILSFVLTAFFMLTAGVCGGIADSQMGFGLAAKIHPEAEYSPLSGNLTGAMMLVLFFVLGNHHKLIAMLYSTFISVPAGHIALNTELALTAAKIVSESFLLAVNIALPFIISGLMVELGMGILSRSVGIDSVEAAMPVKAAAGLIVLYLTVAVYAGFFSGVFDNMFSGVETMFMELM